MTHKAKISTSINSVSPSSSIAAMGGSSWKFSLRRLLNSAANHCRRKQGSSSSPRTFNSSDVESEQVEDATTFCFSSYNSVFVVRLSIMVLLAILIGMLTLLTWHFTRIYTARSLETLAYGIRHEMLQRPILRMWHILNSTVEITTAQVKLSESIISRYSHPPVNQAQQVELYDLMTDMTWALFASRKALSSITINYNNGFVQAFHRDHRNNSVYYIHSDIFNYSINGSYHATVKPCNEAWSDQSIHNNTFAIWYQEPLDQESGERIGKPRPIPPDELINIAGISQVPDGTASWHVAVSKYTDSPLLSAALPVHDSSNGNIVAVVGVTTSFYSVGLLMKDLVEFHSGHIYLTSQEGWLLATSTNTSLLMNSSTGLKLKTAIDSEDHVIRSGAEYLSKNDDRMSPSTSNHEVHIENARLGHQSYYIDSFFLNLKRLPMMGVVIIPRNYIMGKVDERALKTLVVLISASVCILVIGCVCIFVLTNGVSKEMQLRAQLISHLDARRKAEASSNYKSQFLANMSHELRTPMAAVIGLLDILICDECLSNDQFSTVTQIRKCSTALLRLLNNILDLSKVESGKLVLEEIEFDLVGELEGLVDMFSVQCMNHNVEMILDISDDMPKVVQGDSDRIVQIFANLVSNSIKFTSCGYIVLRGWCEDQNSLIHTRKCSSCKKVHWPTKEVNQVEEYDKRCFRQQNKKVLWFEVDDSGCGIDPSKWESVFKSFEQADPSTTRLHGGTGLGLCIVRTLINKMGGDIKVVKKNEQGTLMRLYLLLETPAYLHEIEQHNQLKFDDYELTVFLALCGRMARLIISQWLQKNGVCTYEASEWKGLMQILEEKFQLKNDVHGNGMTIQIFIIVIDIGILNLSKDTWKEQLSYLDEYLGKLKFAWVLNHDTSNIIKTELRRKGHFLMINKPLHKAKILEILDSAIKDQNNDMQQYMNASQATEIEDLGECQETKSDDLQKSKLDYHCFAAPCNTRGKRFLRLSQSLPNQNRALSNFLVELPQANPAENTCNVENLGQMMFKEEEKLSGTSTIPVELKSLKGIRILLAEDTLVLQRVAIRMLEKSGAEVVAVGDGLQVLSALNLLFESNDGNSEAIKNAGLLPYDLILMDCQMPVMDGYEATKAIRKSESETGLHIPIVALTACAMSSDEAICLEVGMDAYLTKPINCKMMVSTILSLTNRITT